MKAMEQNTECIIATFYFFWGTSIAWGYFRPLNQRKSIRWSPPNCLHFVLVITILGSEHALGINLDHRLLLRMSLALRHVLLALVVWAWSWRTLMVITKCRVNGLRTSRQNVPYSILWSLIFDRDCDFSCRKTKSILHNTWKRVELRSTGWGSRPIHTSAETIVDVDYAVSTSCLLNFPSPDWTI
jgi:hypothetical protein